MLICSALKVFVGLYNNILGTTILDLDVPLFTNLVIYSVYKDEIIYGKSLSMCSYVSGANRCSHFHLE